MYSFVVLRACYLAPERIRKRVDTQKSWRFQRLHASSSVVINGTSSRRRKGQYEGRRSRMTASWIAILEVAGDMNALESLSRRDRELEFVLPLRDA